MTGNEDLLPLFIEEATQSIAEFEAGLLQLERNPDDPGTVALIFRLAHSLKGGSSMMGFTEMAGFTHILESLLDQLRRGARVATPAVVDALLASGDVLRGVLARIAVGPEAPAHPDEFTERVRASLTALLESAHTPEPQAAGASLSEAPRLLRIDFRPSPDALQRGLDPLRILAQLVELGQVRAVTADLSALPPLSELQAERCYLAWTVTLLTARPQHELDGLLSFAADADGARITSAVESPTAPPLPLAPPHRRASDRDDATVIRVAVDKVDRLVDLVGELVTTQSMLAQAAADPTPGGSAQLRAAVAHLERHARELHHRILAVRMVSVKTLFARLPRLVRDLAAATGKQVRIELVGEETELDKTVIEKIGDPLLHLVRNAVDHGLESPADRLAAGKPEVGRVRLEAYQRGGNVYIDVIDDGRGLRRDLILAMARRRGLVGPSDVPPDDDIFALIFHPGFSTADAVTDVSGRGVGMDVVKENVGALGGTVSVWTQAGEGTRFRIKLPLTLAVLDGQILAVGDQAYVLPLASITESLRPAAGSVRKIGDAVEVVVVRRRAVPLLRLHRLLDVPARGTDPYAGLVVVVEHEDRCAALLVDRLLGQQQVVIKSLETHFRKVDGIGGATILGDGRVALILDVPGLVGLTRTTAVREAACAVSPQ
ncbi:MAG: chemotaxis protein CheA [Candidatus Rokuibacteriota bacterium]|nr:MAG: chemotaxis protein CheA [Candidatus Rokubacteria bacterium]